jgi:hypothetical protein
VGGAPAASRARAIVTRAVVASGLVVLAAGAFASLRSVRAEIVEPTTPAVIALGSGGAWPTERGDASRDGRVSRLPATPTRRWVRALGNRIDWPPVVDVRDPNGTDGRVLLVTSPGGGGASETALVELDAATGNVRATTELRTPAFDGPTEALGATQIDGAAAAPIVLPDGTRVVLTMRGFAIGVRRDGGLRFRTRLGGEFGSVPRAGLAPLPSGGFVVARRPELIELDARGTIVDRVRLEVAPAIAVRPSGAIVAVTPQGDLVSWRAHRVVRTLGNFGDRATGGCIGGVAIARRGAREYAVCASDLLVEQIDLQTGDRSALLARPMVPFRTAPALGRASEIAIVLSGGTLVGASAQGLDLGPYDVPGSSTVAPAKDGGIAFATSGGEVAPILADDGAVAWAGTDGVALAHPDLPPTLVARCGGGVFAATVAGLASAGPGTLVVACATGRVELLADRP